MSIELVFRFNTTGKQTLAEFANTVKTLNGEIKVGDEVVRKFDTTVKEMSRDVINAAKGLDTLATSGRTVKTATDAVSQSVRSVTGSANLAAIGLGKLTTVGQGVKQSMETASTSTKKFDVGLGSLVESARRTSGELVKLQRQNDASIRQIERQAALSVQKSPMGRIDVQRSHALQDFGKTAADVQRINAAFDLLAKSQQPVQESMTVSFLKAQILAEGLGKVVEITKEVTVESAKYAARTQTLGVVADQLARVNNLSVGAMRAEVQAVQRLGIVRQESLSTISKMVFAQLDLKRATDLARLSQDAAVIAGINSSEALQGIIHGIVTRQPEVLRTYGIVVDFEREYIRVARERGRQLSAQEKQEVALQIVLAQSPKIAGAYEASMLTVGKQMTSLTRYTLDAKDAIGEGLIPVLGKAVMWMTDLAKWAGENGDQMSKLSLGITGAATAYALLSLTPAGRAARGVGAVVGGIVGYTQAPTMEDTVRDYGQRAVEDVMRRREQINKRLSAPDITVSEAQMLRKQFGDTYMSLQMIQRSATDLLGKEYLRQKADPSWLGDSKYGPMNEGMDLGFGVKITPGQIQVAAGQLSNPDRSGPTINQEAIDRAEAAERQRMASEQFAKASKEVRTMLENLREQGLDPYFKVFYDEAQAIRNLREKYPAGLTSRMVADVRSVFGTRANELRESKLAPADLERRSQRTERDMYALRGPGFLFGNAFSDAPVQSVELDPSIAEKRIADFRERGTRALSQALSFQERMVQLQTGPGGELAAINRVAQIRLDNAQQVYELSKRNQEDLNALEERKIQIDRDRQIQQLEFQRRQDDRVREFSGRVFDSMTAGGGGGLRDMVTGQARVLQRQLFVNGTSGTFSALGRYAGGLIPGQQNEDGTPTMLGKLFAGTIFDKQNTQLDKNTTSLERTRRSIDRLTSTLSGGVGAMPTAGTFNSKDPMTFLPSFGGIDTAGIVKQIPGTQKIAGTGFGKTVSSFMGGAGSFLTAGPFAGFKSGDYSVKTGDGRATTASSLGYTSTASRAGNVAMSAAVLGTGAISTYQNLRSGNYLGAGASALATAAAFNPEPISKAAMLLAAAVIPLFGGNRREKRGEELNSRIEGARRDEPTGQSYTFDTSGRSLDYDYRGGLRTYVTVVNQVSAIDARGVEQFFEENQYTLAQNVGRAWQNGQAPALEQQVRRSLGG